MTKLHTLHYLFFLDLLLTLPASCEAKKARSASYKFTDQNLPEAIADWMEDADSAEREYGAIGEWDISDVTNLDYLFQNKANFNADVSQWSTSSVTSMKYTFAGCTYFNADVSQWSTNKVESMQGLFNGASTFNQDLDKWSTKKVTDMTSMFKGASAFNAKLGFDTSQVQSMEMMWYGASSFEDIHNSLSDWDVKLVTSMKAMFSGATRFQGDLSLWEPQSVQSFTSMFAYAVSFDPSTLNSWDVSSAKSMDHMFYRAVKFEAELCWDTLPSDVSGMAMLCGSSGSFDPNCKEPYGSEECSEAYMEMEEDYEVREAYHEDQEAIVVEEPEVPEVPIRGGSGGVGAMNPGAIGRDHPEMTARLDSYDTSNADVIPIEQRSDEPEEPPASSYSFEVGPIEEDDHEASAEPAVQFAQEEVSSTRRRNSLLALLISAAVLTIFLM